jgi:hypothetical protein
MRVILGSWNLISVSTHRPITCRAAKESEVGREVKSKNAYITNAGISR